MLPRYILALAIGLIATGCTQHTAPPPSASGTVTAANVPAAVPATAAAIAWYDGSVESAFATARGAEQAGVPVLGRQVVSALP